MTTPTDSTETNMSTIATTLINKTNARSAGYKFRSVFLGHDGKKLDLTDIVQKAHQVNTAISEIRATPTGRISSDAVISGILNEKNQYLLNVAKVLNIEVKSRMRTVYCISDAMTGQTILRFAIVDDIKKIVTMYDVTFKKKDGFPIEYSNASRQRGSASDVVHARLFAL